MMPKRPTVVRMMPAVLILALAAGVPAGGQQAGEVISGEMVGEAPASAIADSTTPAAADSGGTDPVPAHPLPDLLPQRPFGIGELFKFSIQWGPIKAGTATLTVEDTEQIGDRECYRLTSEAKSNRVIGTFFKVRDRIESFVDVDELLTRHSTKDINEGDHHRQERVDWDQAGGLVTYQLRDQKQVEIDQGTRDILGAFYFVRALELRVGDRIPIRAHDDEETYDLWIDIVAAETIETPLGRFDCLVAEPHLETAGLFERQGALRVWLTADDSHMPVMMQSKIKVGAVSAILIDMQRGRRR